MEACTNERLRFQFFVWQFYTTVLMNGLQVTGADTGDYKCLAQGGGNSKAMNFEVAVIRESYTLHPLVIIFRHFPSLNIHHIKLISPPPKKSK